MVTREPPGPEQAVSVGIGAQQRVGVDMILDISGVAPSSLSAQERAAIEVVDYQLGGALTFGYAADVRIGQDADGDGEVGFDEADEIAGAFANLNLFSSSDPTVALIASDSDPSDGIGLAFRFSDFTQTSFLTSLVCPANATDCGGQDITAGIFLQAFLTNGQLLEDNITTGLESALDRDFGDTLDMSLRVSYSGFSDPLAVILDPALPNVVDPGNGGGTGGGTGGGGTGGGTGGGGTGGGSAGGGGTGGTGNGNGNGGGGSAGPGTESGSPAVAPVPLPASVWLLLARLAGLRLARRR